MVIRLPEMLTAAPSATTLVETLPRSMQEFLAVNLLCNFRGDALHVYSTNRGYNSAVCLPGVYFVYIFDFWQSLRCSSMFLVMLFAVHPSVKTVLEKPLHGSTPNFRESFLYARSLDGFH